mgnify:CR=1 FL=1
MQLNKVRDLTGQRFGKLVAVEIAGQDRHKNVIWRCKCDCGNTHDVVSRALVSGGATSCGCLETGKFRNKHGQEHHGGSDERLYRVWGCMLNRCYDENRKEFKNYGGRGIKVCNKWRESYAAFRDWALANGYNPELPGSECSIDRIDVDGNYEPSNCRWIPMAEQSANTRAVRHLEYRGKTITLREASEIGGITTGTICNRLKRGWSVERAIEQPARRLKSGNASRVA